MKYEYHIAVIGAGSAGLTVAAGAASLGAKVALVEEHKMGGDCLNTGCVPSKAFLKCAHTANEIKKSEKFGIHSEIKYTNLESVMERVDSVIKEIEPHDSKDKFEKLGVDVFIGMGVITGNHNIAIGGKTISAKHMVIATGSRPFVPGIKGLEDVDYLTNENIFKLKKLPAHLIVLGGGPIGMELGQGFRHLGSKVTIIDRSSTIFKKDDPEVAPVMEDILNREGIQLVLGANIKEVENTEFGISVKVDQSGEEKHIEGDNILVSLGRVPNSKGIGLENLGIETDNRGFIITNSKLQTKIKNIYACGDVTGPYLFTHMAGYQAGIVIKNSIFKLGSKVDYSAVPWTTYTMPEVAHVGYTQPTAVEKGLFKKSIVVHLADNDRAIAEDDTCGFLKLILGKKGRIIGATIVGNKAGEMIPALTLAINQKLKARSLLSIIFSYPTESEIIMRASLDNLSSSISQRKKKLIQNIFLK